MLNFPIEKGAAFSILVSEPAPSVLCTSERVLSDRKLSSPVYQAKVLMVLHSDIYSLENLSLAYQRIEYVTG